MHVCKFSDLPRFSISQNLFLLFPVVYFPNKNLFPSFFFLSFERSVIRYVSYDKIGHQIILMEAYKICIYEKKYIYVIILTEY